MRYVFVRFTNFKNAISNSTGIVRKAADFFLISIQRKLVFVFLMFIILPISIVSIISYMMMQEKVKEKVNTTNCASIQQAEINIEHIFSDMLTASNTLILDEDINNILENLKNEDSIGFYADSIEIVKKISNAQCSVLDYYKPSAIVIMDKRGHTYTTLFRQAAGESDQFTQLHIFTGRRSYAR